MPKLFAIGDIHGHYDLMTELVDQLFKSGMDALKDKVVFLGDYIDGGPDSYNVVEMLMRYHRLYPHWVFLQGNHEVMMLDGLAPNATGDAYYNWWMQGGEATHRSYSKVFMEDYNALTGDDKTEDDVNPNLAYYDSLVPAALSVNPIHRMWLNQLPLRHEEDQAHFVHAGFRPNTTIENQSQEDMQWIREEFYNVRHSFGKPVIFGHSAFNKARVFRPLNERATPDLGKDICAIGIDTMRHNTGHLTAVDVTDSQNPIFYTTKEV